MSNDSIGGLVNKGSGTGCFVRRAENARSPAGHTIKSDGPGRSRD